MNRVQKYETVSNTTINPWNVKKLQHIYFSVLQLVRHETLAQDSYMAQFHISGTMQTLQRVLQGCNVLRSYKNYYWVLPRFAWHKSDSLQTMRIAI